jgi:hypothetical protein
LFFGVLTERHWFWVFFFMKNQTRKEKVTYDSNVLKSNWDIYIYIYIYIYFKKKVFFV